MFAGLGALAPQSAVDGFWLEAVGMGSSALGSLARGGLEIMNAFDSYGFVHEHLDGLCHCLEAMFGEQWTASCVVLG